MHFSALVTYCVHITCLVFIHPSFPGPKHDIGENKHEIGENKYWLKFEPMSQTLKASKEPPCAAKRRLWGLAPPDNDVNHPLKPQTADNLIQVWLSTQSDTISWVAVDTDYFGRDIV